MKRSGAMNFRGSVALRHALFDLSRLVKATLDNVQAVGGDADRPERTMHNRLILSIYVASVLTTACAAQHAAGQRTPTTPATQEWCAANELQSQEGKHGVEGSFALLNKQFLEAHARARARACDSLASERLVIRYSFGTLEARWNGKTIHKSFVLPEEYHPIKDISHAVLLAALLFAEPPGRDRSDRTSAAVRAMDSTLNDMRTATNQTVALIPTELLPRQERLLRRTRDAVDAFARGELNAAAQQQYFVSVREDLMENLRAVSAEVVRGLHKEVQAIRDVVTKKDPSAWNTLVVVIGVTHQARAREIGIQYFQRLLQERVGEGARNEQRLVIAENRTTGSDQYGLLSAHLVDQAAAAAIFADPLRLQWDVLSEDGGVLNSLLPPATKGAVRTRQRSLNP
jgi:hypothetical protein